MTIEGALDREALASRLKQRTDPVDVQAQRDRDAGMPVREIAAKYGKPETWVWNVTSIPEDKKPVRIKLDIDWAKVQQERDAGARVADLAAKYKCDVSLVYRKTKKSTAPRPGKMERAARTGLDDGPPLPRDARKVNGSSGFDPQRVLKMVRADIVVCEQRLKQLRALETTLAALAHY